jgi:hypothetical protein
MKEVEKEGVPGLTQEQCRSAGALSEEVVLLDLAMDVESGMEEDLMLQRGGRKEVLLIQIQWDAWSCYV